MSLTQAIKNRYGSKKGLLRYVAYETLKFLGFYRRFTEIDFAQVKRLVFICHGNICRSPLGEAVARQQGFPALSFGLDTRGNDSADPRAIAWAKANGYSLDDHVTKRIDQYDPQEGDLLVAMEPKHIRQLSPHFINLSVQVTLAGLWLEPKILYLHDPYNSNQIYFDLCERRVEIAARVIIGKVSAV
ncbi:MAG TPA: hypothetical protein VLC79_10510 [Cellvibrio sp.]|nr:hypothetical protein [Cellvibrio sp.]